MKTFKQFLIERLTESNISLAKICLDLIKRCYREKKDFIVDEQPTYVMIAFKGTSTFKNIATDLNMGKDVLDNKGSIWHGFINSYKKNIRPQLLGLKFNKEKQYLFTGHSLGAVYAELAFSEFKTMNNQLFLFAPPSYASREYFQKLLDENEDPKSKIHVIYTQDSKGTIDPVSRVPFTTKPLLNNYKEYIDVLPTEEESGLLHLNLHRLTTYQKVISKGEIKSKTS